MKLCEWKLIKIHHNFILYLVACKGNYDTLQPYRNTFTYCPYCGGKIEYSKEE